MSDSMAWLFTQYLPLGVELAVHSLHMKEQIEFPKADDFVTLSLGSFPLDDGRSDMMLFASPRVFSIVAVGGSHPQILIQAIVTQAGDYKVTGGSFSYLFEPT
jgi:hypothetical protein